MATVDHREYAVRPSRPLRLTYPDQSPDVAALAPGEDVTSEGEIWFHPYGGQAPYKIGPAPKSAEA